MRKPDIRFFCEFFISQSPQIKITRGLTSLLTATEKKILRICEKYLSHTVNTNIRPEWCNCTTLIKLYEQAGFVCCVVVVVLLLSLCCCRRQVSSPHMSHSLLGLDLPCLAAHMHMEGWRVLRAVWSMQVSDWIY